jgi:hypothetical protein
MRVSTLLAGILLATSLLCHASDQAITPPTQWLVSPSGSNGLAFVPLQDQQAVNIFRNRIRPPRPDADVCYTMRTYIMARESRDSDVTRRDGHVTCQPAWKFEVRRAVGTGEDR